jgi:hypothetical protein
MSVIEPLSPGKPAAPSLQSLLALSWLNFFLAGMQTAFGPIAVAYLAAREWTAKDIGFVLSIGRHRQFGQSGAWRRAHRCRASETNAGGEPLFRLWPSFSLVTSRVLQGITGGVLGPAVVAISLGLVGHARLAERLGQS